MRSAAVRARARWRKPATILPSPLKSSASHPSAYIQRRIGTIEARMEDVPFDRTWICAVRQDPLW